MVGKLGYEWKLRTERQKARVLLLGHSMKKDESYEKSCGKGYTELGDSHCVLLV